LFCGADVWCSCARLSSQTRWQRARNQSLAEKEPTVYPSETPWISASTPTSMRSSLRLGPIRGPARGGPMLSPVRLYRDESGCTREFRGINWYTWVSPGRACPDIAWYTRLSWHYRVHSHVYLGIPGNARAFPGVPGQTRVCPVFCWARDFTRSCGKNSRERAGGP
jgi:hypothetical protein